MRKKRRRLISSVVVIILIISILTSAPLLTPIIEITRIASADPGDVSEIKDAVPKAEPRSKYGNP